MGYKPLTHHRLFVLLMEGTDLFDLAVYTRYHSLKSSFWSITPVNMGTVTTVAAEVVRSAVWGGTVGGTVGATVAWKQGCAVEDAMQLNKDLALPIKTGSTFVGASAGCAGGVAVAAGCNIL